MTSVSYIVTIYNKESCIKEMVLGLKNQIGNFDREFIFVDDGSTDNSLSELRLATTGMTNVHIVTQDNAGPSKAVNTGIKLAKCDYVCLVDGDDKLLPDATTTLIDLKKNTGCKVVKGIHVNNYSGNFRYNNKTQIIQDSFKKALRFMTVGSSVSLIETNLLNQVRGCDERVFIQDYSLALRLSKLTNFAIINKVIAHNIDQGQQRLSSNKLGENRDAAYARYYFVKDNLNIEQQLKLIALSAQMKKSWSWFRKHNPNPFYSKYLFRYIVTRGALFNLEDELILRWMKEACEIYS